MLHRANSDAGIRLRQARSSAAINQRSSEPLQVPIHPEHAALAAAKAFRVAYNLTSPMPQSTSQDQPRPRKLVPRNQGTHFEAKRAGKKAGTSRSDGKPRKRKPDGSANVDQNISHECSNNGRSKIAIRSSEELYPTGGHTDMEYSKTVPSPKVIHKSKSMYDRLQKPDQASRTLQKRARTPNTFDTSTAPIRQTPDIAGPQRERRSDDSQASLTDPFRRRFTKPSQGRLQSLALDTSVPAFNFAHEHSVMLPTPTPDISASDTTEAPKERTLSGSFKERIKKIFCKEKRTQTAFPSQQVSAKQLYFNVDVPYKETGISSRLAPSRPPPPPPSIGRLSAASTLRHCSDRSFDTFDGSHLDKSRVTSWTDSTVAGTTHGFERPNRLTSINELPSRTRDASDGSKDKLSIRRQVSSLTARRVSRNHTGRSSEDSQRLYEALRMQMQEILPASQALEGAPGTIDSSHPTVPFIARAGRTISSRNCSPYPVITSSPTIRALTPEPASITDMKQQPLTSGKTQSPVDMLDQPQDVTERPFSPEEYRARRFVRSQNRWQDALKDESPVGSRALRNLDSDNPYVLGSLPTSPQSAYIPFAIRHVSRATDEHHGHPSRQIHQPTHSNRIAQVISPSIYSSITDRETNHRNSPRSGQGTLVTITGREIRSYAVNTPTPDVSKEAYREPSQDWQAWLSENMKGFDAEAARDAIETFGTDTAEDSGRSGRLAATEDFVGTDGGQVKTQRTGTRSPQEPGSRILAPVLDIRPTRTRRPKVSRQSSKVMNERYPILEVPQNPSDKGLKALKRSVSQKSLTAIRRISSTGRKAAKTPSVVEISFEDDDRQASGLRHAASLLQLPLQRDTGINSESEPHVTPRMPSQSHFLSVPGAVDMRPRAVLSHTTAATLSTSQSNSEPHQSRAKSAVDLRARYKPSRTSLRDTSINIRRKPLESNMGPFEDQTLQKITEGPYGMLSLPLGLKADGSAHSVQQHSKENASPSNGIVTPLSISRPSTAMSNTRLRHERSRGDVRPGSRATIRTVTSTQDSGNAMAAGKASPGQRMAQDFLRRRGGDDAMGGTGSSPVFI